MAPGVALFCVRVLAPFYLRVSTCRTHRFHPEKVGTISLIAVDTIRHRASYIKPKSWRPIQRASHTL